MILKPNNIGTIKPWHDCINQEMRKHLIRKMIQSIIHCHDESSQKQSDAISRITDFAKKVEREIYENAVDLDQYFHLIAQKIYKIQKEIEEKRFGKKKSSKEAISKPWQKDVNADTRKTVMQKFIENSTLLNDELNILEEFVEDMECEAYEKANDEDEYIFIFAHKIQSLKKEYFQIN